MKSVNKSIELKIYEKLGIKFFKKFVINLVCFICAGAYISKKKSKEEIKFEIQNTPSNYFIEKKNGIEGLKKFKKKLFFNALVHIIAGIFSISAIGAGLIIPGIIATILNLYCIMLQRYNYVRINNTIAKLEHIDKKQRTKLKEDIKKNSIESEITRRKIKLTSIKEEEINIDELLNLLTLSQLKTLRNEIISFDSSYTDIFYTSIYSDNYTDRYSIKTKIKRKND